MISRFAAPTAFFSSIALAICLAPPSTKLPAASAEAASTEGRMQIGGDPLCMAEIPGVPVSMCFAPNVSPERVAKISQTLAATWAKNLADRDAEMGGEGGASYNIGTRWSLNGSSAQGQPVTIRWSIVPDGLSLPDSIGLGIGNGPSNVLATFTTKFGSAEAGKVLLRTVFARWSELTGVTYSEVTDDGAAWGSAGGSTRGDVRIAGRSLGTAGAGILAYNSFPNDGDMVINTRSTEVGYWTATNNNRYLRNVLAHEHGHGLGLYHVCPTSQTKLMEPFISTNFDGPQVDDIRAGQRQYGDRFESNDTAATASTNLTLTGTNLVTNVSIDDNSDVDLYKFTANAGSTVSVSVSVASPNSYLSGPQNSNGSCSAGTSLNPGIIQNLAFSILRGTTGATTLLTQDVAAAGSGENVSNFALPTTDTYFVKVFSSATTDDIQLYSLVVTINQAPAIPADFDNNGIVNGGDLGILLAVWGPITCGSQYDLNGDCVIDGADLGVLLASWG